MSRSLRTYFVAIPSVYDCERLQPDIGGLLHRLIIEQYTYGSNAYLTLMIASRSQKTQAEYIFAAIQELVTTAKFPTEQPVALVMAR